jgi:hypothetical protein
MSKTAHNMGAKIEVLAFFSLIGSLSIWIWYKKLLKIFQIGPFLADWQTPYFSKRPAI